MQTRFRVDHEPIAQPRQRHRVITGKGKPFATNYTPAKHPVQTFKAMVKSAAVASGAKLTTGPVRLDLILVFPRPKALCWKTRPTPRLRHTKKPDRDNCEKAVADALTGVLWRDDSQICAGEVLKWVASGDEAPHVEVVVTRLEP